MPKTRKFDLGMKSVQITPELLSSQDAVLILTNHSAYDWNFIGEHAQFIVDSRNAMKGVKSKAPIAKV